jgi:hypothetical protein
MNFPVRAEKIPCSAHLREFDLQPIEIAPKSPGFAHGREFDDNALK